MQAAPLAVGCLKSSELEWVLRAPAVESVEVVAPRRTLVHDVRHAANELLEASAAAGLKAVARWVRQIAGRGAGDGLGDGGGAAGGDGGDAACSTVVVNLSALTHCAISTCVLSQQAMRVRPRRVASRHRGACVRCCAPSPAGGRVGLLRRSVATIERHASSTHPRSSLCEQRASTHVQQEPPFPKDRSLHFQGTTTSPGCMLCSATGAPTLRGSTRHQARARRRR